MVTIVGVVVTHDASVVSRVQPVVDVCKVVAGDLARDRIDPDLPAQLAVAPFVGNLVGLPRSEKILLLTALICRGDYLTASNTLYVVRFKKRVTAAEKATLGLLLLTSSVRVELARHARIYADGLLKFEPADLGAVHVPVVEASDEAVLLFREATALLLSGQEVEASKVADAWLASLTVEVPTLSLRKAVA